MERDPLHPAEPRPTGRFGLSTARKVSLFAGLAAVLTIMIGAGFANMSASDAPTSLETAVVRWVTLTFIVIAAAAYFFDRRQRERDRASS